MYSVTISSQTPCTGTHTFVSFVLSFPELIKVKLAFQKTSLEAVSELNAALASATRRTGNSPKTGSFCSERLHLLWSDCLMRPR